MTPEERKLVERLIAATKEVVARTEGKFFGLKFDHPVFMEARGAIRDVQRVLEQ